MCAQSEGIQRSIKSIDFQSPTVRDYLKHVEELDRTYGGISTPVSRAEVGDSGSEMGFATKAVSSPKVVSDERRTGYSETAYANAKPSSVLLLSSTNKPATDVSANATADSKFSFDVTDTSSPSGESGWFFGNSIVDVLPFAE